MKRVLRIGSDRPRIISRILLIIVSSTVVWLPILLGLAGYQLPLETYLLGVLIVIEPLSMKQVFFSFILVMITIFLTKPRT
jgi:hypothetical protein